MKSTNCFFKPVVLAGLLLVSIFSSHANIVVSKVVAGGWPTTTTWVGGVVPTATDSVVIVAGAVINTGTNQSCGAINILGTLTLTGGNYLTVAGDGITSFGSVAGNGILGFLSIGNRNIQLTGDWTFNGTSANSGENVTFQGTGNQLFQGIVSTGTLGTGVVTVNKPSGQVILGSNMTLNNQGFTITAGTFNPNGFILTSSKLVPGGGTLIVDASTWAGNYNIVTLNNPSAGNTIQYTNSNPTINAAIVYQNLSFTGAGTAGASAALSFQGDLLNTGGGILDFGANNITISGTVASSNVAAFTTTGSLTMSKTLGTATMTGNFTSGSFIMIGSGGAINLGLGLTHTVTSLTMTRGTLNGGSSTLNISGSWTGTGAIFTAGTGTIGFVSSLAQTILVAPTYYNLSVSGIGVKTISGTPLNVGGTLTVGSGSFLTTNALTNYNLNIAGDWVNNGGSFTNTNTTVILNGVLAQSIRGTAGSGFNNLTISNTTANVILGTPVTVASTLKFTSGKLDASNFSITMNAGAVAITGTSATSYIITGNGVTTTGLLNVNSVPAILTTLLPIGTQSYYLPATVNTGVGTGQSFSAFVFQGITFNALPTGSPFTGTVLNGVLNAIWNIARTSGSGNVDVGLNWASSGIALEGSAFQAMGLNIGIAPYSTSWQAAVGSGSVATETALATFSTLTPFGVGMAGVILPVIIIDFAAILNDHKVDLSWDIAGNASAVDFEVQRSNDLKAWKVLGSVVAKPNNSTDIDYSFSDYNPMIGPGYYRLKIKDNKNDFTYSSVKKVNLFFTKNILVFPNPASDFINIYNINASEKSLISLLTISGQVLDHIKVEAGITNIQIPVKSYLPGQYIIKMEDGSGAHQSFKIVIR